MTLIEKIKQEINPKIITGLLALILSISPIYNKKSYSQDNNYNLNSTNINLENPNTLEIGIDNWYPYEFGDKPEGISVEILEEATKRMNKNINYQTNLPWPRALKGLENNLYHLIITGSWNEEREKWIYFENLKPITYFTWCAYKINDINSNSSIENTDNRIGVVRDYFYPENFKNKFKNFRQIITNSETNLINMLKYGRIEIALLEKYSAEDISKKIGIDLVEMSNCEYVIPAYPLINNNWKEKENFVNILNNMHDDKTIKKIHEKWKMRYLPDIPREGDFLSEILKKE